MYQSALKLAKSFDISDSRPRRCGRQTTKANHPAEMANFFVLSIFGQFDYELESRLLKSENRFHAQHLLPCAVDKLTDDHVATIYEAYQVDVYLSLEVFRRDFVNPVLYPSIATILIKLRVLLTMPVASAIAEMSFSVLRRLKTYVRSTMKNDRLSSLGLMHINRDFEVDLHKAMEVFVSVKTRRADFGQF